MVFGAVVFCNWSVVSYHYKRSVSLQPLKRARKGDSRRQALDANDDFLINLSTVYYGVVCNCHISVVDHRMLLIKCVIVSH